MITLINSLPERTQVSRGIVILGHNFHSPFSPDLTQSTAVPSPTSTKPPMTILSTSSSATLSQSTSTPSSPLTSNTFISRANAVGEGVVGGILGLFVLCALLYGYFQWKKRLARNKEALLPRTDTENPQAAVSEVIEKPFTMAQVRGVTPPVLTFVSSHS